MKEDMTEVICLRVRKKFDFVRETAPSTLQQNEIEAVLVMERRASGSLFHISYLYTHCSFRCRFFVPPCNDFGTSTGAGVKVFGILYWKIELDKHGVVWVRDGPAWMMPTER